MTRPRNRRHQNWRPRRGGGDEDEVVGGEDDKRIPGPSLYTQKQIPFRTLRVGESGWGYHYPTVGAGLG